jgi:hypothetical protein
LLAVAVLGEEHGHKSHHLGVHRGWRLVDLRDAQVSEQGGVSVSVRGVFEKASISSPTDEP